MPERGHGDEVSKRALMDSGGVSGIEAVDVGGGEIDGIR